MELFVKDMNAISAAQVVRVMRNLNVLKVFFEGTSVDSITCEDTGGIAGDEIYTFVMGSKKVAFRCVGERGGYLMVEVPGIRQEEGSIKFI